MAITHSSLGESMSTQAALEQRYHLDLDERAGRERCHFDGGSRWGLRADVAGNQRLTLVQREGRVRLGFDLATLIPAPARPSSPEAVAD